MTLASHVGVCLLAFLPAAAQPPASAIDQAVHRFFNYDTPGALLLMDSYVARNPRDPLGHVARGGIHMFSELSRLEFFESAFFLEDKNIIEKKNLKPDPIIRRLFHAGIDEGQRLALEQLARNPADTNALFALCNANGLLADYVTLIDRKPWSGVGYARQSQVYAVRVLRADPTYYDAYLTTGFSEYLVGSMPFFLRWFIRFDSVEGSKEQAIRNLTLVARSGRYFRPFAKIFLALIYLREKRPVESQRMLAELVQEYPANPMCRKELAQVTQRLRDGRLKP